MQNEVFNQLKYNIFIDRYGTSHYFNNRDQLHRTDGPAVIYADGSKKWFLDGKLHRINGPAVEFSDGRELWYINGKRHREYDICLYPYNLMTIIS